MDGGASQPVTLDVLLRRFNALESTMAAQSEQTRLAVEEATRQAQAAAEEATRQAQAAAVEATLQAQAAAEKAAKELKAAREESTLQAQAAAEKAAKELKAAREETTRLAGLLTAVLSKKQPFASPISPAQLGRKNLEILSKIPLGVIVMEEDGATGPAFFTPSQQVEATAIAKKLKSAGGAEAGLVKFITPFLATLRLPPPEDHLRNPVPLALVNSEDRVWMEHPSSPNIPELRLKPDLFLTWLPFVQAFDAQEGVKGSPGPVMVGVLGGVALQWAGCVVELFEAKREALTDTDFGKLSGYHECLLGTHRSLLFNARQCWMYESSHGSPIRLQKLDWSSPGSQAAVRDFLGKPQEPPLVKLLRALLVDLRLATVHIGGKCYLGSGGTGHVFTVHSLDDPHCTPRALKVALDCPPAHLHLEYQKLREVAGLGLPVVQPMPGTLRVFVDQPCEGGEEEEGGGGRLQGGGFLLSTVGKPFLADSQGRILQAFQALAELHAEGVYHGDARIPNLMSVDDKPVWIDLLGCVVEEVVDEGGGGASGGGGGARNKLLSPGLQRHDARTLARSILGGEPLVGALASAVELWKATRATSVQGLAEAVWKEVR